jgi:hypothetical protein
MLLNHFSPFSLCLKYGEWDLYCKIIEKIRDNVAKAPRTTYIIYSSMSYYHK